jgi:hypothetical protein
MERRDFLKLSVGLAAGGAALATAAQAAPIPPISAELPTAPATPSVKPAVVSQDEVDHIKPEQVYWHRRHWGWRRRHWGWRHRHWHRYW